MTSTPLDILNQQLSIISSAGTSIHQLVQPYSSSMPVPIADMEKQLVVINGAVSSIQAIVVAAGGNPIPTPPIPPESIVQPIPEPTPIPIPSPVPPIENGVTPILHDDYRSYGNTAGLQAAIASGKLYNSSIVHPELAILDTENLYNNHPTIRYTMPGGTNITPQLGVTLPKSTKGFWLRAKVRWSPGFTTKGVSGSGVANAYKLFEWGFDTTDGSSRLEISNTTQYVFYWAIIPKAGHPKQTGNASQSGPNIGLEWSDGVWYDYIVYYNPLSSTTANQSWWMMKDGQNPILKAGISCVINPTPLPKVDRVILGVNFNQVRATTQSQYLNIGSWEIIDAGQYPDPWKLL